MKAHRLLQNLVARHGRESFRECWVDFAVWEDGRGYSDDPSHPSKAALDWILRLNELASESAEFPGQSAVGLDQQFEVIFETYAMLDHPSELIEAIEQWIESACQGGN